MKIIFFLIAVHYFGKCVGAPTRTVKDILLIPSSFAFPQYIPSPQAQVRGPLDFIGNWIQSSEWFPIEINVPDTFAAFGNGVGTFATNVGNGFNAFTQNLGNGFQTFTQNVGNNVQNFAQNLSQRFPVLAVVVRPNTPARYFVLVPRQNIDSNGGNKDKYLPVRQLENDILEAFP